MKEVIVHCTERVFDGFFKIDAATVSHRRFDGTMSAPVRRLCFERGDAAAAILHDREAGTVIFVNQFRYPTWAKGPGWLTEAVAGMIEAGEDPEACLRREVLEETGYSVEAVTPIATFYPSPGGASERIFLFYAEVSPAGRVGAGGGAPDEGEDIQTLAVPVADLDRLLADGVIQDAKTIIGIQWFLRRIDSGRLPLPVDDGKAS